MPPGRKEKKRPDTDPITATMTGRQRPDNGSENDSDNGTAPKTPARVHSSTQVWKLDDGGDPGWIRLDQDLTRLGPDWMAIPTGSAWIPTGSRVDPDWTLTLESPPASNFH